MVPPRLRVRVGDAAVADLVRDILTAHLPDVAVDVAADVPGEDPEWAPTVAAAREALHRTRRLLARGAAAGQVQHAANNPLTALLAEAQLLEMEPMPPEQLHAVRRIVALSRRVATVLRQLDVPPDQG